MRLNRDSLADAFSASLAGDDDHREDDLELLRLLLDDHELRESEETAFEDMLERLEAGQKQLTTRQRAWAKEVADRLGIVLGDPATRNASVPRGREVAAAPTLSEDMRFKALEVMARRRATNRSG